VTALADLHLELLRRNARLRAWRAYGVPVEGGWDVWLGTPRLQLRCAACDMIANGLASMRAGAYGERQLINLERKFVKRLINGAKGYSGPLCPHLAPLLGADPPEVVAILELELLAG
jgi:hypothetical protein